MAETTAALGEVGAEDPGARFTTAARTSGLDLDILRFPQGTHTAADAAAAIGCDLAAIVKSVLLIATGTAGEQPVLVLTSGAHRADTEAVRVAVSAEKVRQAKPAEVLEFTGYPVGAVAPLGHPQPLTTLLDSTLLALVRVYAAAGTVDTVTGMAPADLQRATSAQVIKFSEGSDG